jgi:hypothetical protein
VNVEVNTPEGWETVEDVIGFRIDEDQNLIIWRGPADPEANPKGWTDVAFYRVGHWLSCLRQETE